MPSLDEQILKASKEVIVKYIETGRISPALFPNTFKTVYNAIADTVKGRPTVDSEPETDAEAKV